MSSVPLTVTDARFSDVVLGKLAALRTRCRLYLAADGAAALALWLLALALGQFAIDRTLRLTLDQRALLNLLISSAAVWLIYRHVLAPVLRPLSDQFLARLVDHAHPRLGEQLSTAVQFSALRRAGVCPDASAQLIDALLHDALRAADRMDFRAVLNHRRAQRRGGMLLGVLLAALLIALLFPSAANVWMRRNWLMQDVPWPQFTYIRPLDFDGDGRRRAPRGEPLQIVAEIEGVVPRRAALHWHSGGGARGVEAMTLVGRRRFQVDLPPFEQTLRFRIVGGDERTREYTVELVDRPAVKSLIARVTPPAYTGLASSESSAPQVLELLAGSRLELEAELSKPVASARFGDDAGPAGVVELTASDRARVIWDAPVSGAFRLDLTDFQGFSDNRPARLLLRVNPDQPPEVTCRAAGVGAVTTPAALVALEVEAQDPFGIADVRVMRQVDGEADAAFSGVEFSGSRLAQRAAPTLDLETLRLSAGSRLRIWGEARDFDPAGPNIGRSEPLQFSLVTPDELRGQLAQRERELRREFEQIISAQRGLQDAVQRLAAELAGGTAVSQLPARLAGLQRRQDSHATRVDAVRRKFQQIAAEMRSARIMRRDDEERLGVRIIDPLGQLVESTLPSAAQAMLAMDGADGAAAARQGQAQALREMQAVLASMLEWEGFREAVALLEEILREQQAVQDGMRQAATGDLEAILGDLIDEEPPDRSDPEPRVP